MDSSRRLRLAQVTLSIFAGLVLWEIAGFTLSQTRMAPVLGFGARPGALTRLIDFIGDGEFFVVVGQSLSLFCTGFVIAIAIGIPLGLAMARFKTLRIALETYILALYVTPMAALIPFILSMFGFAFVPKTIVVVLFSVFPILYNTLEGARSLKPEMIEVARAFRSSERRLWLDVLLPFTLPFALTGIRQGIGRALVGMVAAEVLLSNTGLGGWLVQSARDFDMAAVLGAISMITILGISLMAFVRRIELRYAAWRGTAS
jgi:ABC-type nitrate/sulfonate/bicarbonate transport system permease component